MTTLSINWDITNCQDWTRCLGRIARSNIIQTFAYAKAIRAGAQQTTRFGLVLVDGAEKGIVQIQEIKLCGIIHFVFLDRGPLWFDESYDEDFFKYFQHLFPRRWGRKRRVIPELGLSQENQEMMARLGYRLTGPGYKSIWLDLTQQLDDIRKHMKQKWRNQLNASETKNLDCAIDTTTQHIPWLMRVYTQDRRDKKYAGPSPKLITHLARAAGEQGVLHLRAVRDGKPVAAMLFFLHGQAATYQIGWSNAAGRATKAHYFLMWQAIKTLKVRGITGLDLGGIDEAHASGVTRFKQGLGGEVFETVGVYG